MKKRIFIFAAILCIGMVSSIIATAKSSHSEVMTKKADGTYIVNTTTLGKDIKGFRGNTPLGAAPLAKNLAPYSSVAMARPIAFLAIAIGE